MSIKVFDINKTEIKKILGGPIKLILSNNEEGSKNQLLAFGMFKPGEGLYPHLHHKSEEIYYVVKGKGTLFFGEDNKPMNISTNQIIYIPADTPHGVTNTSTDELIIGFIMTPGVKIADYKITEDLKITEEKIINH